MTGLPRWPVAVTPPSVPTGRSVGQFELPRRSVSAKPIESPIALRSWQGSKSGGHMAGIVRLDYRTPVHGHLSSETGTS
jgi:hypothetical protein